MSGGAGVATTTAGALARSHPRSGGPGCDVGAATGGVGAVPDPPLEAGASPGPLLALGVAELCSEGAGVARRGGGGGVGIFVIAIDAGRCSIETTSAWLSASAIGGCRPIATTRCNEQRERKRDQQQTRDASRPSHRWESGEPSPAGSRRGRDNRPASGWQSTSFGEYDDCAGRSQRRLIDRHVARALVDRRRRSRLPLGPTVTSLHGHGARVRGPWRIPDTPADTGLVTVASTFGIGAGRLRRPRRRGGRRVAVTLCPAERRSRCRSSAARPCSRSIRPTLCSGLVNQIDLQLRLLHLLLLGRRRRLRRRRGRRRRRRGRRRRRVNDDLFLLASSLFRSAALRRAC